MKSKSKKYRINVTYKEWGKSKQDISFEKDVSIPEPNSKEILNDSIKYFNKKYGDKWYKCGEYYHPTLSVVGK